MASCYLHLKQVDKVCIIYMYLFVCIAFIFVALSLGLNLDLCYYTSLALREGSVFAYLASSGREMLVIILAAMVASCITYHSNGGNSPQVSVCQVSSQIRSPPLFKTDEPWQEKCLMCLTRTSHNSVLVLTSAEKCTCFTYLGLLVWGALNFTVRSDRREFNFSPFPGLLLLSDSIALILRNWLFP